MRSCGSIIANEASAKAIQPSYDSPRIRLQVATCALLPVCQDQEGSTIGDEKYENEKVQSRDSARKPEQDVRRIERVSDVSVRTITREEIGRLGVKRGFGAS